MMIWTTFLLIHINNPIQVGEVPVQVYALGVAPTHKPVLELTRLKHQRENQQLFITVVTLYLRSSCMIFKMTY